MIIGAGAAGLMAAIWAGRAAGGEFPVVALDGAPKIGAKILISGGGRCNVTHDEVDAKDFNGSSRNVVARILRTFDVPATIAFFESLDVMLKREETGKLFPVDDDARTVLRVLIAAAEESGADVRTANRVVEVVRAGEGFLIITSAATLRARAVILATGGRSIPKSGSDGHGYSIAASLGHSVSATTPALVPLLLPEGHWMTTLSGISIEGELVLTELSGRVLQREKGSLLFTHFGLSGPVVLDMSRHWIAARNEDPRSRLSLNVTGGAPPEAVRDWLVETTAHRARALVLTVLSERLPERLAAAMLDYPGIDRALMIGRLGREQRARLVQALTNIELPLTGDRGFNFAEVTAGGVPLSEINPSTMESRKCPGLYLCGEILDVDGKIGGFNFQWAWASGKLAGESAARRMMGEFPSPRGRGVASEREPG